MATSDLFERRWQSGQHVGDARPIARVWMRRGAFQRGYFPWDDPDGDKRDYGVFPDQPPGRPWRARWVWRPDSPEWVELPNVQQVQIDQDFQQNGLMVATITLDNVLMTERVGALGGIFHALERGAMSPWRGYKAPNLRTEPRDPQGNPIVRNEWFQQLAKKNIVRVEQSYGEDPNPAITFVGLIDDLDMDSSPDRVTLTCRDMGQMLTDQRMFGWNTDAHIGAPTVFADRMAADDTRTVGGAPDASSTAGAYPTRLVIDDSARSYWRSHARDNPDRTEWVQIRVPQGRYETIRVKPAYADMDLYIGVFAKDRLTSKAEVIEGNMAFGESHKPPKLDGELIEADWVDVGKGYVPGDTNGGWPYMVKIAKASERDRVVRLNHVLEVGDNSIVRVAFRNLRAKPTERTIVKGIPGFPPIVSGLSYYAGCARLQAIKRTRRRDVRKAKWILVDDAADVVRICLRWAGFTEWRVEDTGVRIGEDPAIFGRSSFLIDPIKAMSEKTGHVFFMGDPSGPDSRGLPTFRPNRALQEGQPDVPEPYQNLLLRDTDLLTGIQVKLTEEPLAWNIRVRGKEAKARNGGERLGGGDDPSRRLMVTYKPPWTRGGRMAGVLKHLVHVDNALRTREECMVKAFYIAFAQALASATAVVEIPGQPGVELDQHVGLMDTGTGLNTRLWVANRSSTFVRGEETSWKTTLGGALIDTPDIVEIKRAMREEMPQTLDPLMANGRRKPPLIRGDA